VIRPVLQGEAFLRDVAAAHAEPGLHLWWLGQSGFLLQWRGRHVLLDPYLSDSLTVKYAGTARPHVRMTERVVEPAALAFADVVACSHAHTDHLDPDTLRPILAANPRVVLIIPEALRTLAAERLGCPPAFPVGLDDGQGVEVAGVRVVAVAAAHEQVERDARGRCLCLGYVLRLGSWVVYHSGDTVRYPGLAERLRAFRPDVALLPINGRDPARGVPGNLDGPEAARLARDARTRLVIPCHYEMFTFNTASPAAFVAEAERLGQPYRVLRCGERWSGTEPDGGGAGE
jgi:L-ascorbate metabolism protein UlaG (beta-lactamase superfamily)